MAMEREIINYLPLFVAEYKEIQEIMAAEQIELSDLWDDLEQLLNDQFIDTSSDSALSRWEKILNISPKDTDTLDERRFRIKVKLNEMLPYTYRTIKSQLTSILGEEGYRFVVSYNDRYAMVKLALSNEVNIQTVTDYLRRVLPASMVLNITLFNQHIILQPYTHAVLSAYTHYQLRTEVL